MAAKKKGAGKAPGKKFDPTVGGWKRNRNERCPVDPDVIVQVRQRDGSFETGPAIQQFWLKEGPASVTQLRQSPGSGCAFATSPPSSRRREVRDE